MKAGVSGAGQISPLLWVMIWTWTPARLQNMCLSDENLSSYLTLYLLSYPAYKISFPSHVFKHLLSVFCAVLSTDGKTKVMPNVRIMNSFCSSNVQFKRFQGNASVAWHRSQVTTSTNNITHIPKGERLDLIFNLLLIQLNLRYEDMSIVRIRTMTWTCESGLFQRSCKSVWWRKSPAPRWQRRDRGEVRLQSALGFCFTK